MDLHTVETVVIGLAIIAFITYRLSQWQSVRPSRLMRMPLILGVVGVISLAGSGEQLLHTLTVLDIALLGAELTIGVVAGWLIGRLTEIRTFADGTKSKLVPAGIAVWLGFIAVRIGFGVAAAMLGASLAAMPGMTLIVIAVIKGVQGSDGAQPSGPAPGCGATADVRRQLALSVDSVPARTRAAAQGRRRLRAAPPRRIAAMSWTDAIEDRWGGRNGTIRLALRLIGLGFFGYLLITSGAFTGPLWVAVGTGAAIAISLALLAMRAWRPFDRWALVLTTALMALGVVLNPSIDYLGSVFFVIGGIILVGQPEVPVRLGVSITAVLSIGLVVRAVLANPEWTVLLSTLFGAVAVVLFGANRRQRVLRLRETARVTELEQRSRIARDLHDVLAHSLGGLVVQLDAAGAELETGQTAEAATRIVVSRQLAVEGLREARTAVEELRTGAERVFADDPTDLVDALERVVRGPVGLQLGCRAGRGRRPASGQRGCRPRADHHDPRGPDQCQQARSGCPGVGHRDLRADGPPAGDRERARRTARAAADELAGTGGGAGLAGCRERMSNVGGRLDAGREGQRWVVSARVSDAGSTRPRARRRTRWATPPLDRLRSDGELRR